MQTAMVGSSESSTVPMVNDLLIPKQSCVICNLKFLDISAHYSTDHQTVALKGGKDHQCLLCKKKLASTKSLVRHVRNQHFKQKAIFLPKIKEFLCTTCSTNFTSKFNLDRHKVTVHEKSKLLLASTPWWHLAKSILAIRRIANKIFKLTHYLDFNKKLTKRGQFVFLENLSKSFF